MCLHCGPLDRPCNRCLGVVKSDPYSYSNPGFPTYKDRLGKCRKVSLGCLPPRPADADYREARRVCSRADGMVAHPAGQLVVSR